MHRFLVALALAPLLLLLACESGATGPGLQHSFFQELVKLHAFGEFEIKKHVMTFEYLGDDYVAEVSNIRIEPNDDAYYPSVGYLECRFTSYGEPVEFDALRRAGIDPNNIVALWNKEKKAWEWTVEIQPLEEY